MRVRQNSIRPGSLDILNIYKVEYRRSYIAVGEIAEREILKKEAC